MKKRMFFTPAFLVTFLAALALVSLFRAHESFANGPTYYSLADYYPLTQGRTWTYQVTWNGEVIEWTATINGFEKVGGVKTAKRVEDDGDYECEVFDSGGLKAYRWYEPSEGFYGVYNPPTNPFPAQMYVGQTHSCTFVEKAYNRRGEVIFKVKITWSVTLEGLEDVTVDAGYFPACLKFSFFESSQALKGWIGTGTEEGTIWLANGIGEVKFDETERWYDDQGQLIWEESGMGELISYSGPIDSIVTSPNGGNIIPSGSTYPIQWTPFPGAATYKLKGSENNGKEWETLGSGIIGTSYDYLVYTPKRNKTQCLMKVVAIDPSGKKVGADRSDWTCTVEVVKMTWPNGGETLTSGDIPTITWTTHETKRPVAKVVLKYTKNGGRTWKKITAIEGSNPGTHLWTVPDVPRTKSKCKVKVVLKDAKGNTVGSDTSDSYFTIEPTP